MPQHTQQSIAAVSARKFRQSTGNVLKSTGEEKCMVLASILPYFGIKLVSGKSSTFAESNELKFNIFKQTFIITKIAI